MHWSELQGVLKRKCNYLNDRINSLLTVSWWQRWRRVKLQPEFQRGRKQKTKRTTEEVGWLVLAKRKVIRPFWEKGVKAKTWETSSWLNRGFFVPVELPFAARLLPDSTEALARRVLCFLWPSRSYKFAVFESTLETCWKLTPVSSSNEDTTPWSERSGLGLSGPSRGWVVEWDWDTGRSPLSREWEISISSSDQWSPLRNSDRYALQFLKGIKNY